jgi:hypothetical protein
VKLVSFNSGDVLVNPESVCRVQRADPNAEGFLTELVDEGGKILLRDTMAEVAAKLHEK